MTSESVKDIMTTAVVAVPPEMPLLQAAKILSDHDFAGVPVADKNGILVGILTEYDLISKNQETKKNSLVVKDAMNPEPIVFHEGASFEEVAATFRDHHRVNPVPVVDEAGKVIGIVSRYDLIKTFLALAAHQLSAPLTAIGWSAESLLKGVGGKLTNKQREYIEEIYHQIKTLQDTVSLFFNVTRLESGIFNLKPAFLQLAEVAEDICGVFGPILTKRNLKFVKSYDESKVTLDERILRIVLQNLLSNAIRYTPDGGTIAVEVRSQKGAVFIKVSDTGLGISTNEQSQMFSRLFRTKEARALSDEGMGLGLYLVKMIVEKSGGKIWFESKANKGSTFYVELPVC